MGLLSSRFTFNSDNGQFHSNGIIDGDLVTGAASTQSFSQRKHIERNRQTVNRYHDAAVVGVYRREALASPDKTKDHDHEPHRRTSRIDERSTSQVKHRKTSRVDEAEPRHKAHASGKHTHGKASHPRISAIKPSFKEPGGRGYNPYK